MVETVALQAQISPAIPAKPAKSKQNLMLIPERREFFCFNIFSLFSIINDIFFIFCVIRRIGRFFCFEGYMVQGLGLSRFLKKIRSPAQKNKNMTRERGRFFAKPLAA
jgi:hypothetical protein